MYLYHIHKDSKQYYMYIRQSDSNKAVLINSVTVSVTQNHKMGGGGGIAVHSINCKIKK